ncbi:MAG: nucleotidyltransferase domain-containing protein [Rivularia sp. T60_A2020_040]|nr:nucleotidyltransferase domain-containing protein [Rivularia sp. T60_A2020_040]
MSLIQNISSLSKVKPEYQILLNQLKTRVKTYFATDLIAYYLLGSVGRGNDKPGVSDMDIQIILKRKVSDEDEAWINKVKSEIEPKYSALERLDIGLIDVKELDEPDIDKLKFILTTDSVLICGEDITNSFKSFVPSLELAKILNNQYRNTLDEVINYLPEPDEEDQNHPEYIKDHVRWIAKNALRLSLGIIMVDQAYYTRSMEEMADKFAEKYPIYQSQIQLALLQYHQPTNDLNQALAFLNELSKTIYQLADEKLIKLEKRREIDG